MKSNFKPKLTFRKKLAIVGFALYLTFILLSAVPYIAESQFRSRAPMDKTYRYDLVFPKDGEQSHYVVERYDTAEDGEITLVYYTDSHTLDVDTINLKKITIDCESVYEDESMDVFKQSPGTNEYYIEYFKSEHDLFVVTVTADNKIEELRFKNAPEPSMVFVNDEEYEPKDKGIEWWVAELNWSYEGQDIVLTHVPKGVTEVKLYFEEKKNPVAAFTMTGVTQSTDKTKIFAEINDTVKFDGSSSSTENTEGKIVKYSWSFGDDSYKTGKTADHKYTQKGTFDVTLTVTDDLDLKGATTKKITIVEEDAIDRDGDGMPDWWEEMYGLDPDVDDAGDDEDNSLRKLLILNDTRSLSDSTI